MKTKKIMTAILAFSMMLPFAITGCANNGGSGAQKTLVVANWKGYGSDADYAVKTFEKANNCKVVHQYINSEDEYINILKQGGTGKIDVFLPNLAYMQRVIKEGLVVPLDKSKLNNYNDLIPQMRDAKGLCDASGKFYAVPWVFGTTGIGYNTDSITKAPTSLAELWNKDYSGKIAFNDEPTTAVLTAALYLKSPDPYNPDLDAVKKALIEAKKNSKLLWATSDDFTKAFTSGSVVLGNIWCGTATSLSHSGQKISYVYPEEGVIEWQDNWCIAKGTQNEDLAYKWLNFMTSKEFLTQFTSDLSAEPPVPANQKVLQSMSDENKKALWVYPAVPKNLVMQQALPDETSKKWLDLWNEVKAS